MGQTKEEICEQILALFKEYGNSQSIIKSGDPLKENIFNANFVDSFSITTIIALVEEKFSYTFSSRQLQGDEIRTVEGIANILIREKSNE